MPEIRRRILLIKPTLPYPPNQGSRALSFALIKALSRYFDVTVLARIISKDEKANVEGLSKWCRRVIAVQAPNKKSIFHRAAYKAFYLTKALFIKRSIRSMYDCPGTFIKAARRLAGEEFDLVIIEYWHLYKILPLFDRKRLILITHDIDMLVNKDASLLERNLFKKAKAVMKWIREKREEIHAYRNVDMIFALTEHDSEVVKKIKGGAGRVEVLPVGVETDYFSEIEENRNPREVLFLGALEAVFNQDALRYFVSGIYPCLSDLDGLKVSIVGGDLPGDLRYFESVPGVEVAGRVKDVRKYLRRAACMVVPLRFGGGLRIRILEAMASRLPVVCTSVAIRGMPFEPGKDYLEANDPREFGEQIGSIMESEELRERIAESAYRKLERHYSSTMAMERLRGTLEGIIDSQNLMI